MLVKPVGRNILTEPIAKKKENVAALLSIYCESVGKNPRGPAPFLQFNTFNELVEPRL